MTRRRQLNAVGAAATALVLIVTGCAVLPTAERSASPIPTSSLPAATATGESEPAAKPSPSPSPSPSTAPPSEAPPDPPPAVTPLASLTSGPLRIDGLALVVADELRVRSAPGTGADSKILAEPLTKGREVFVVAGPVPANGYLWWQVRAVRQGGTGAGQPFGWIAAAGRDGEIWVAPGAVACPADPSVAELAWLGGAGGLTCYGGRNLQIRAFRQQLCGDGSHNLEAWSPAWITSPFGYDELLDREPNRPDQTGLKIHGRAHPSLLKAAAYFDCGGKGTGWFDVTGHFDDPVSSDCRITFYDETTDASVEEEPALSIMGCRQTFVYTELRPAPGP
jgi:hypothetical protein